MVERQAPPPQVRSMSLSTTLLGAAAIALSIGSGAERPFVLNLTASVPVGVYWRSQDAPRNGDFVVVSLPSLYRDLADRRGYIPRDRHLIKIIAAGAGELICRVGTRVWIAGHKSVWAKDSDAAGRRLPAWHGCRVLKASEVFVLGSHPDSFDSRYFGPIDRHLIAARVYPILVF